MSRLQAGGLALIIGTETGRDDNLGKVVTLDSYIGVNPHPLAKNSDYWLVKSDDLIGVYPNGFIGKTNTMAVSAKNLMPLGDKQTQDELAKEKEIEFN
ncbi:hypothetical protein [Acinetobacter phage vB_AbaM_fThrA]|nr:hypothetical protein [Acinetobacter phage vB_AbaM_fThrA]